MVPKIVRYNFKYLSGLLKKYKCFILVRTGVILFALCGRFFRAGGCRLRERMQAAVQSVWIVGRGDRRIELDAPLVCGSLLSFKWKVNLEMTAFTGIALDAERAVVLLNNSA